MTLYEIDQKIADAIELGVDTETGEIITTEALDQLQADRDAKVEGIALYIKNISAEAEAIKVEKLKLAARQAVCEHKAQRLKEYLDDSLQGQRFKTARVAISYRDAKASRLVVDDAALVPAEWRKPGEPDKAAIRDLLRQGGSVPGCRLEDAHSIIIR